MQHRPDTIHAFPRVLRFPIPDPPVQPLDLREALVHFQTVGEITPNPKLLCDDPLATDGIRASRRQHPIQHRHADGSLGLLSGKAAGSQPWSDQ